MKTGRFDNFAELKALFPGADKVGNKTVFNIGGNKYRLIAALHYNRNRFTFVLSLHTVSMTKANG